MLIPQEHEFHPAYVQRPSQRQAPDLSGEIREPKIAIAGGDANTNMSAPQVPHEEKVVQNDVTVEGVTNLPQRAQIAPLPEWQGQKIPELENKQTPITASNSATEFDSSSVIQSQKSPEAPGAHRPSSVQNADGETSHPTPLNFEKISTELVPLQEQLTQPQHRLAEDNENSREIFLGNNSGSPVFEASQVLKETHYQTSSAQSETNITPQISPLVSSETVTPIQQFTEPNQGRGHGSWGMEKNDTNAQSSVYPSISPSTGNLATENVLVNQDTNYLVQPVETLLTENQGISQSNAINTTLQDGDGISGSSNEPQRYKEHEERRKEDEPKIETTQQSGFDTALGRQGEVVKLNQQLLIPLSPFEPLPQIQHTTPAETLRPRQPNTVIIPSPSLTAQPIFPQVSQPTSKGKLNPLTSGKILYQIQYLVPPTPATTLLPQQQIMPGNMSYQPNTLQSGLVTEQAMSPPVVSQITSCTIPNSRRSLDTLVPWLQPGNEVLEAELPDFFTGLPDVSQEIVSQENFAGFGVDAQALKHLLPNAQALKRLLPNADLPFQSELKLHSNQNAPSGSLPLVVFETDAGALRSSDAQTMKYELLPDLEASVTQSKDDSCEGASALRRFPPLSRLVLDILSAPEIQRTGKMLIPQAVNNHYVNLQPSESLISRHEDTASATPASAYPQLLKDAQKERRSDAAREIVQHQLPKSGNPPTVMVPPQATAFTVHEVFPKNIDAPKAYPKGDAVREDFPVSLCPRVFVSPSPRIFFTPDSNLHSSVLSGQGNIQPGNPSDMEKENGVAELSSSSQTLLSRVKGLGMRANHTYIQQSQENLPTYQRQSLQLDINRNNALVSPSSSHLGHVETLGLPSPGESLVKSVTFLENISPMDIEQPIPNSTLLNNGTIEADVGAGERKDRVILIDENSQIIPQLCNTQNSTSALLALANANNIPHEFPSDTTCTQQENLSTALAPQRRHLLQQSPSKSGTHSAALVPQPPALKPPFLVPITHYPLPITQSQSPIPTDTSVPTPTIQIKIGRIEVRSSKQPASPSPRSQSSRRGSGVSLSDYLNQRNGG
jgi:hypothetical protein